MSVQKLSDIKAKSPTDLLAQAEELEVENASSMRKQDMLFAILKELADRDEEIIGVGVLEVLQDGFGFLRSPEASYLPGPDDIYLSPNQIRRLALSTGDTVEGPIRAPKAGERYFALLKVNTINFDPSTEVWGFNARRLIKRRNGEPEFLWGKLLEGVPCARHPSCASFELRNR